MKIPQAPRPWTVPPLDLDPEILEIRAVSGDQVALARAVVLSLVTPESIARRVLELPDSLRVLLDRAPAPDTWVPIADFRNLVAMAAGHSGEGVLGRLARMTAERDAGHLEWLASPEMDRKLPGARPEDLVAGIPPIFRSYFQGGSAQVDFQGPQEGGLSLWMHDLFPGWARMEAPEWICRALEAGYGVKAEVSYLEPETGRPWWHRYHIRWS